MVLIGLTLAAAYVAFGALLYFYQGSFVYYPDRQLVATPKQFGLEYEPVSFRTQDGVALSGWYLPAGDERGVLLFFHGNAGNISHRMLSLQVFNRLGLSTFIFDYRGYGHSEGRPDEPGTYRDGEAAWRYLIEHRNLDPRRIIVFGRSLGAAVASYIASRYPPRALIVESGFTSVPDLATRFYPFMPVRWLSRFEYATKHHLTQVSSPVLIVHSREDDIIPFEHGRALFEAAQHPKQFLEIVGTHNEGFVISGKHYEDGLNQFLSNAASM
ncbi:MAG: alpha/beta hydrolase [Acidiferrobacterales bacterium]